MSSFSGYNLDDISQVKTLLTQILADPSVYPDELKSWIPNWLGVNPPDLNVDQITGFDEIVSTQTDTTNAITALSASLVAGLKSYVNSIGGSSPQSTTSTSYTNLATPGPTVTVPAGTYVVSWAAGAFISNTANGARMAISVNGATPTDSLGCSTSNLVRAGISFSTTFTVALVSNTFQAKYKATAGTANFADRWITASPG